MSCLLYPVSDSIGWNRIFSRKLVRRDVILKDLLHDFLLLRLSDGVLVERRRWSVIVEEKKLEFIPDAGRMAKSDIFCDNHKYYLKVLETSEHHGLQKV